MPKCSKQTIGLVIRTGPYQQRSARSQLDVALVAAALERPLRLYFLGQAVFQLVERRNLDEASLPPGYRAWGSLPGLTEVTAFAEPAWLEHAKLPGQNPVLPAAPMVLAQMRLDWQACDKLLIL